MKEPPSRGGVYMDKITIPEENLRECYYDGFEIDGCPHKNALALKAITIHN